PLSTLFVLALNNTRALVATREENSNGHVDITFHMDLCKPPRTALGEAKILRSYDWHEQGLTQLISRYSTGRESRGLILVYVKKANIKSHIDSLRTELDKKLPCSQTNKCDLHPSAQWSFVSRHQHSSGEQLEVWHLGCNLHHPEVKVTQEETTE